MLNQLEGAYNDVSLNGVILISTILDFGASADTPGNEMAYVLNLPSMARPRSITAGRRRASVEAFVEEARRFAIGPYLHALVQGSALGAEERAAVRRELARFTGLSEGFLERADLRVSAVALLQGAAARPRAWPSAGSTPAIPAATMTMPARSRTTIPASTASTPAIPRRSTPICARRSASAPTATM